MNTKTIDGEGKRKRLVGSTLVCDVWDHISQFTPLDSLVNLILLCKNIMKLADSEYSWKGRLTRDFVALQIDSLNEMNMEFSKNRETSISKEKYRFMCKFTSRKGNRSTMSNANRSFVLNDELLVVRDLSSYYEGSMKVDRTFSLRNRELSNHLRPLYSCSEIPNCRVKLAKYITEYHGFEAQESPGIEIQIGTSKWWMWFEKFLEADDDDGEVEELFYCHNNLGIAIYDKELIEGMKDGSSIFLNSSFTISITPLGLHVEDCFLEVFVSDGLECNAKSETSETYVSKIQESLASKFEKYPPKCSIEDLLKKKREFTISYKLFRHKKKWTKGTLTLEKLKDHNLGKKEVKISSEMFKCSVLQVYLGKAKVEKIEYHVLAIGMGDHISMSIINLEEKKLLFHAGGLMVSEAEKVIGFVYFEKKNSLDGIFSLE